MEPRTHPITADSQPAAGGLASDVAAIAVAYRGNAEPPDALAAEIVSGGGIAREFGSDMADPGAVEQLVDDVEAAFGSVDILVANHSVAPQARYEDVHAAMFDHTLTGFHPSPTRHAVVGFHFQGRLTRGPAVRVTDRRHSLHLDVLTMTQSAYVQVRCAVVALWSEHQSRYAHRIRPASIKLDSILPTSSDVARLAVHLRAPLLLARRALPRMRERGLGRVLFISSVAAFRGVSSVPTTPVLRPGPTTAQTALQ